ncbi:MAG: UDP-glucose 4-epimerase GalE [Planctomycetota bacterium]
MRVLVTGGAGYIGSHAVKRLIDDGHTVVALDNLERGHRAAFHAAAQNGPDRAHLLEANLNDTDRIAAALQEHQVECVINFAALAYVGESVDEPLRYYRNNTAGVISLLEAMDAAGVNRLVHSSTCATYGEPPAEFIPIPETCPQSPINPYGWSKLFNERVFLDYAHSKHKAGQDFAFAALRYFNVAGCAADGALGEDHEPETHLIPVLLNTALGKRASATIFGTDYDTPDGTCIRDYVHVEDLIDAHVTVLQAMGPTDQRIYNLGVGNGFSVKEIIEAVKKVTGVDFKVELGDRRPGDPPQLYANPAKIQQELNWTAKVQDPATMAQHAWNWFQKHPDGYGD